MIKRDYPSEASPYLRLLVRVSAFIFVATIISKIATYGYKILIVRYFGLEPYGLYSLALIVIGIVAAISSIGLNEGIVRYISFYRGNRNFANIKKLTNYSINIFIITSLTFTLILLALAPIISDKIFHSKEFAPMLRWMAISLPFIIFAGLYLSILRGFEKIRTFSTLINIYQNITRLALLIVLILAGFGVVAISISYVLTFIGLAILSRHYSKKQIEALPIDKEEKPQKIMPEILSYSWPLLFVGVLYNIFYWSDSLVLGYFTEPTTVGLYNVAVTLISLFSIAPDLFMQLLFPLVTFKLSEGKKELISKIVKQVIKWIYLINIPLFIFLFLFPEQAIIQLFGIESIEAAPVLRILSMGALFMNLVGLSTSLISIKGKTKLVLVNFSLFTILNIALDFIFIPTYGMVGAASATFITAFLFATLLFFQIRRIYRFNLISNYFLKLFFTGIFIFLIGYLIRDYVSDSLVWVIIVCASLFFVYLTILYKTKGFDEEDKDILKLILSKMGIRGQIKSKS